ncbi:hypothetical protein FOA43_001706 [Brettanomyces nanus]|uniref:Uncharacterized protein n=1 Tax=Eeniella nana TaxID=13502 RepID=A0A875S3K6_EENNA|nr:uncharacterized protein FOA43_001706 [Brettanomyces nanus]QPG74379.1 hypothetical protein FOA43_001706 [Brettanomyces nanus]
MDSLDYSNDLIAYCKICCQIHDIELSAIEQFRLQDRVESMINTLKVVENAEKKYAQVTKKLQQEKRVVQHKPMSSDMSSKKYNQLMIRYNMSHADNKSLEKNYQDLKQRYDILMKKKKGERFQQISNFSTTPYLPKLRNMTFKSPDGRSPLRTPIFGRSPSRSPSRRVSMSPIKSPSRFPSRINPPPLNSKMLQSTPRMEGSTTTPSPSARKLLSTLSNKHLRMLESPSKQPVGKDDDDFSFSRVNKSTVNKIRGSSNTFSTPHGTRKVLLRRTLPISEEYDVSPTGKRSREENEATKTLSKVQIIRGGQRVTGSISPLKTRNNKLRDTILKDVNVN